MVRMRFDEALAENRRAIDLAPLDILGSMHLAWLYFDAREADKTIAQSQRVLEMDPAFTGAYTFVARGYEQQGKWPEAIAAYEQAKGAYGKAYLAGVAHAWAAPGYRRQAEGALAKLKEFSKQNYVSPLLFAEYYTALGDRDGAFELYAPMICPESWMPYGYVPVMPG
jgi:tetratricopeptide (TPR) repeat protein